MQMAYWCDSERNVFENEPGLGLKARDKEGRNRRYQSVPDHRRIDGQVHNGEVRVESKAGSGSVFQVSKSVFTGLPRWSGLQRTRQMHISQVDVAPASTGVINRFDIDRCPDIS